MTLDIGLEVRLLREKQRCSSKDLAEKIGLSPSQMSRLETGQRRIDARLLDRIAEVLGVSPSYFFRGSEAAAAAPEKLEQVLPAGPVIPELGKRLRAARHKRHLSVDEVAKKLAQPKDWLLALEAGEGPDPDPELLERLVRLLKLDPLELVQVQQGAVRGLRQQVARLSEAHAELHQRLAPAGAGPGPRPEAAAAERGGGAGSAPADAAGIPLLAGTRGEYPRPFGADGRWVGAAAGSIRVPGLEGQDCFGLHVVGDRMLGDARPSFREGDIVVFSLRAVARTRDLVLCALAGRPSDFGQLFHESSGQVRIQPLNLAHAASAYPQAEVLGLFKLVAHIALW